MKVYNTLTRKKEEFKTLLPNTVKMYACGITPYDDAHLGHGMQAVIFDTIRRYLEYKGFSVTYVRNWTDIDDKIIAKGKELKRDPLELSFFYIKRAKNDLRKLKVKDATYEPRVTQHISDIIEFISDLINKGYAYVSNGSVYFDVDKFPPYGKLSNRTKDELIPEDTTVINEKKNPYDFALWKKQKPGEPAWESPWGKGRPGWHIECSTLSQKYLGDTLDIHGGGVDLVFPHHENEIAQSEARTGTTFSNYWLHNGLVMVEGRKMSKSLGNFVTLRDLLDKYHPDVIRYFIFSFSYNSNLNFSYSVLKEYDKKLYLYYKLFKKAESLVLPINKTLLESNATEFSNDTQLNNIVKKFKVLEESFQKSFVDSMDDNFNTALVIGQLNKLFSDLNILYVKALKYIKNRQNDVIQKDGVHLKYFFDKILQPVYQVFDILNENPTSYISTYKKLLCKRLNLDLNKIESMILDRAKFKKHKNYSMADKIRDELLSYGITVLDEPDGTYDWMEA